MPLVADVRLPTDAVFLIIEPDTLFTPRDELERSNLAMRRWIMRTVRYVLECVLRDRFQTTKENLHML